MKITESAIEAILGVMKKKKLDPKTVFLEIGVFEGNLGMAFTKDKFGKKIEMGELNVLLQNNLDAEKILVDFVEMNDKKGLIFTGG